MNIGLVNTGVCFVFAKVATYVFFMSLLKQKVSTNKICLPKNNPNDPKGWSLIY